MRKTFNPFKILESEYGPEVLVIQALPPEMGEDENIFDIFIVDSEAVDQRTGKIKLFHRLRLALRILRGYFPDFNKIILEESQLLEVSKFVFEETDD